MVQNRGHRSKGATVPVRMDVEPRRGGLERPCSPPLAALQASRRVDAVRDHPASRGRGDAGKDEQHRNQDHVRGDTRPAADSFALPV